MLTIRSVFVIGGIGTFLLIVTLFIVWHYRRRFQSLKIRTHIIDSALRQREKELTQLVDQLVKQEDKRRIALYDALEKTNELKKLLDGCWDRDIIRFRLTQLSALLDAFKEKTEKPSDIVKALSDTRNMRAITVPDKKV